MLPLSIAVPEHTYQGIVAQSLYNAASPAWRQRREGMLRGIALPAHH